MDLTSAPLDTETLLAEAAWVRRLARRLLADEHLAEDAAQEAMILALRRPPVGDAGGSQRWLGAVTRHLAMRWRAARRGREWREEQVARPEAQSGAGSELERLELHQRLVEAVMGLEEPYRSTLVQRFFEELEPREIARRQQVAPAAARQRLSRGLAMLRARLKDELGDRKGGWSAALAWLGGTGSGPAGGGELLEVALMSKKVGFVVAALLVGIGLTWRFGFDGGEGAPLLRPGEGPPAVESPRGRAAAIPATSEPDRVALNAPAGGEPRLEVTVVDEHGRPLAGVELLAIDEIQLLGRGTSDGAGRASLAGSEGAGTLAAQATDRPPAFLVLDRMCGERRLELSEGRRVAGRLLVDGEVPDRPFPMKLLSNEDPLHGVPESARALLLELGLRGGERQTVLDELGRFAFEGLAARWTGELRLPVTRWFVEAPPEGSVRGGGSESLYLRRPLGGLELRSTRMPSARGRVVWADTGEGVGDAQVWFHFSTGGYLSGFTNTKVEVDERGCFEHVLELGAAERWLDPEHRPSGRGLRVTVSSTGNFERRSLNYPDLAHAPDLDLGDIAVERLPGGAFHFLVQDGSGAPIVGAVVRADQRHAITDPEGRGRLEFIAADLREMLAGAPGYRVQLYRRTDGGQTRENPAVIVLNPGSRLTLQLQDRRGRAVPNGRVTLVAHEEIFPSSTPFAQVQELYGGTTIYSLVQEEDGAVHVPLWTDEHGEIRLFDLIPDLALEIRVEDELDGVLLEDRLVSPGPGEVLDHLLRLQLESFSLEGEVRDDAGAALPNVRIRLGLLAKAESDGDGRFRLAGLFPRAEPVVLTAELSGHVTARVEGLILTPGMALPELILERGVRLRVVVVDELGESVPVTGASAAISGYSGFHGELLVPGRLLFHDLPPCPMRLRTTHGPHTYEIDHDPSRGDLRWVLPTFGSLTASPPAGTEAPEGEGRLEVRVTSCTSSEVSTRASLPGDGPYPVRWSRPVPLEPGRWKVELVLSWREGGDRRVAPLGPAREVEVRPGEETRVEL